MKDLPSLVILIRIIPRLPAKGVTRCKVMCKDWLAYHSTPEFDKNNCYFLQILDGPKLIALDKSSCVIRYVDDESPRCVLGTNVHIPFDAHSCNVIFLASLDGMGFYNVDDDSPGFCVDSVGDYNIVHIKHTHFRLTVNIYSFSEGSWSLQDS
ncbi:putative F-box-like domain superfamily protein [Helianthus anomalus]